MKNYMKKLKICKMKYIKNIIVKIVKLMIRANQMIINYFL